MPVRCLLTPSAHWMLALLILTGCAASSPSPAPAQSSSQPEVDAPSRVREQADPPPPLLEHPGKPTAAGQVWQPGRWNRIDGKYHWRSGQWTAPKPGHLWQPHVWRREGKSPRWVQAGGQWAPDPNKPPGWYRPRR